MPDLAAIAVVATLFVALLYAAIQSEPHQEDAQPAARSGAQQQKPAEQTFFSIFGYRVVVPDKYEFECKNPRDTAEADLCEQLRMAKAGERQVHWVKWQYVAGVAALAFLALTFWEAKRTADAAMEAAESARQSTSESKRSADAAQRSADIAEESHKKLERPYIFVADIGQIHHLRDHVEWPHIKFSITNHGRTPAVVHDMRAKFSYSNSPPELPLDFSEGNQWHIFHALGAGETNKGGDCPFEGEWDKSLSGHGRIVPKFAEGQRLFLYVAVSYSDTAGTIYNSHFCWEYNRAADWFMRFGGHDYNRMT